MPLVIDGHNLIGSDPTIGLSDPQDEVRILHKIAEYCRTTRHRVVVYFDRAAAAADNDYSAGLLSVRFVRTPRSADEAILDHLRQLGGEAKNWTLVSSDRALRASARELGARLLPSGEFASDLNQPSLDREPTEKPESVSDDELEEWMRLFRGDDQRP